MFLAIASMGYGKTVALYNFLQSKSGFKHIWFTLKLNEMDDIWLWQKLCLTLGDTFPSWQKKLRQYSLPKNGIEIEHFLHFFKVIISEPTVLVFDNFQEIKSETFHSLLDAIVRTKISDLHIVIISRVYPHFQYSELFLKGYCYILEQDDFAFSLDEMAAFFHLNGFSLKTSTLNTLMHDTEGWVSAIYLSLLDYAKNKSIHTMSNSINLMKSAVYDQFTPPTQHVLLLLSLVDYFTAEQATFITQDATAPLTIKKIAANNCFIKYDATQGTYTIHTLLKTVLNSCLEETSIDVAAIYCRSAQWYLKNNDIILALTYYQKAGEYDMILNLIPAYLSDNLFDKAPHILLDIFDNITLAQKIAHPLAYIAFIHFYITTMDQTKGKALLLEARKLYEADSTLPNKDYFLGELMLVEAVDLSREVFIFFSLLKQAYILFDGKTSAIYNHQTTYNHLSPYTLNLYTIKTGQLYEIVKTLEENYWYFTTLTHGYSIGYEHLISAEYHFAIGDYEVAKLSASKAIWKARTKHQLSITINALFTLMRISVLEQDFTQLKKYIHELQSIQKRVGASSLITRIDLAISYVYGNLGIVEKTPLWLQNYDTLQLNPLTYDVGISFILYCQFLLNKKEFIELEILSDSLLKDFKEIHSPFSILLFLVYNALAKYHLYSYNIAKPVLLHSLQLAAQDQITSPFVENATHLLPLLEPLACEDAFANKLLPLCRCFKQDNDKHSTNSYLTLLTKREMDVLALLEKGYKNKEIAKKLSIAQITVEKTLSNIYRKLNVKNRTAAVAKIKNS